MTTPQSNGEDGREGHRDGTWAGLNDSLREKVRVAEGRAATPSAGRIDSQSVKTSKKGVFEAGLAEQRSMDANGSSEKDWGFPSNIYRVGK